MLLSADQPFLVPSEAPPSPPSSGLTAPTLRPYQERGIAEARALIAAGRKRVLLVSPTGSGKTVLSSAVIVGAVRKAKRALFLAHRKELIDQSYTKLRESGLADAHLGTILAGDSRRRPMAPVQVASVQTLVGRAKPPADLVFVDEAQHVNADSYGKILAAYPDATIVGLTATPCRADGRGLGDVFTDMVLVASFHELADQDFLVTPRVFTSRHPLDLSKMKSTGGDYNLAALDQAMNTRELVGDVVEHWQRIAEGRTTVVFASSIEHSRAIVERFVAAGVAAEHLDGKTPKDERTAILARLARGETTVVSNMNVLGEGWDLPRTKCVVLARPTKSLSLYLQMAGRGLRPWNGVSALLLDHAGCVLAHGFPQDDREWSLEGKPKKGKAPPVRTCPKCYAALPGGTAVCPECGHVFESEERDGLRQVDGQLVEVVPPSETPIAERRAWYAAVLESAARGARKLGFARHRYREQFGKWPSLYELERVYYPPVDATAVGVALPPSAEALPLLSPSQALAYAATPTLFAELVEAPVVAPPPRARRINLTALLAPPVPAARHVEEVTEWSL